MTMLTVPEIVAAISAIDSDHALVEMLHCQIQIAAPNLCSKFAPRRKISSRDTPLFSTVMVAQCSVFDNWLEFGGKRPRRGRSGHYRDRFKVEFSFWKQTSADVDWNAPDYRATAHLWTGKEIVTRSKGKSNMKLPKALPDQFRSHIIEAAGGLDGIRIGFPYTRDGRTILYNTDETWVAALEDDLVGHVVNKITISKLDHQFVFEDFRTTTSKGNPLAKNCFAHSRMTTSVSLAAKWNAKLFTHQPASSAGRGYAG